MSATTARDGEEMTATREEVLRETALTHAGAVVAGDMQAVLDDLDPSLQLQMASMASLLPEGLLRAELVSFASAGDGGSTGTRYVGAAASLVIRSTWQWRRDRFVVIEAEPLI